MKVSLWGLYYFPKRSSLYTKTHRPYLYYQTPLVYTRDCMETSTNYSKTRNKIWHSVYLDTGIEDSQFYSKLYQVHMAHLRPKVVCIIFHAFCYVSSVFLTLRGETSHLFPKALWYLSGHTFAIVFLLVWYISTCCCLFLLIFCDLFILSLHDQSQLRSLKVGVGKSNNMAKSGRKST